MAGLFALSINRKGYQDEFLKDLFWGTFYQQHLGEDYSGLSTYDDKTPERIKLRTHRGLFRPAFTEDLEGLEGIQGIGYCGSDREPFLTNSKLGRFSSCFSGNIINRTELIKEFKNLGHSFEREDDIEVLTKLISQGENIVDGIKKMTKEIKGAFTLLLLTEEGIYGVRSLNGHWPLIIGVKNGAIAVSSESGSFSNLGFKILRDIKPGEIILMRNGEFKTVGLMSTDKTQICSFLWVYSAFPNDVIEGIPVSLVRKKLGQSLAHRDIERGFYPDIIAPVPDSGRFHAIGYFQEFCQQMNEGKIKKLPFYDEILLKYPYAGRSFTPQNQQMRDLEAQIKLLRSGENYQDKTLVICDDSIVRGTQAQTNLVPKLRDLGIKEIHFRISNPELVSYCPWGKTTKKGETLISRFPTKEARIKFLGIESLEYNTIEDLAKAIGISRENLCLDCDLPVS